MSTPTSTKRRPRRMTAALALAAGGVLLAGSVGAVWSVAGRPAALASDTLHVVKPEVLEVSISKDGELQAAENIELSSKVEGRVAITWLAREGTHVQAGETVVELDGATIRQSIEDGQLELQATEATLTNAREQLAIQLSNNAADQEAAEVEVKLAEIEMKKYVDGTYPQVLDSAKTKVDMAQLSLQQKQDDLAQARSLFGRGFVTATEIKKAEQLVTEGANALREAQTALRVQTDFTHQADMATLENALAQAKKKLARVVRQSEATRTQKEADVASAEQQVGIRRRKQEHLAEQLASCTIKAPADGMVVYVSNRDRNELVQEGAEARERQVLVRLPDPKAMKATVRISEAQVSRLREGMPATVQVIGDNRAYAAKVSKISVLADSGNRWWNPDLKEYPVDLTLDEVPAGAKPGVSVSAKITTRQVAEALTVPPGAVYAAGRTSYVFVPDVSDGEGYVPREVKLGASSPTQVQVTEGVAAGDRVLHLDAGEGGRLLALAGVKPPEPQPALAAVAPPPAAPQVPTPAAAAEAVPAGGEEPRRPRGGGGNGDRRRQREAGGGEGRPQQPTAAAAPAEKA